MKNYSNKVRFMPWLIIKRFLNYITVKNAIKNANKLHKLTLKQYYVLKIHGKVKVYDRQKIKLLVARGILSPKMNNALTLRANCIYYTRY